MRWKLPTAISVGSIAGILALFPAWWAIEGHWQTKAEADSHAKKDDQRGAWQSYGIADLKSTILANRLNDCKMKSKLTVLEASICQQYDTDAKDAAERAKSLYMSAMSSGKE